VGHAEGITAATGGKGGADEVFKLQRDWQNPVQELPEVGL